MPWPSRAEHNRSHSASAPPPALPRRKGPVLHFPPSPRRVPAVDRRPDVRRQVRRVVCVGMTRSSQVPLARARFSGVWLSTTTTALGPAPSAKNVPTSEHRSHPGHPTTPAPVKEGLELAGRRIGKVWPSRAHLSTQPAERCWIDSASGLKCCHRRGRLGDATQTPAPWA